MPDLWIPLVMMTIVGTLAFNFTVVMPLFVTRSLHGDDGTFTILYSILSIGSLAGALATARRVSVEVRNVVWGAAMFGVAMMLLAIVPNLAWAFPAGLLMGFTSIVFMTPVDRHRADAGRPGDARAGAGPAGDRVPRQHADRRTAARCDLRPVGRPRRAGRRGHLRLGAAAWGAYAYRKSELHASGATVVPSPDAEATLSRA